MIKIIKTSFTEVGKGWFNMKETNKITYDFGKLKKFLTLIRLMMQDTLQSLVWHHFHLYYEFIKSFLPKNVVIKSTSEVINEFEENVKYEFYTPPKLYSFEKAKPLF